VIRKLFLLEATQRELSIKDTAAIVVFINLFFVEDMIWSLLSEVAGP
jgi:hypothetical protein